MDILAIDGRAYSIDGRAYSIDQPNSDELIVFGAGAIHHIQELVNEYRRVPVCKPGYQAINVFTKVLSIGDVGRGPFIHVEFLTCEALTQ